MSANRLNFPKDFLWGAATSSYQVEGDNKNCDWWEWEKKSALKETSGGACRHYELFKEDFDLAKQLNHNAHRLSIEWSRIEPREGKFSQEEINHYRDVILALRERGIEPVVTLHHFTNPVWFAALGGWVNSNSHKYFLRYTEKIVSALCDKVRFWVTVNEPILYAHFSYCSGRWPPQKKSFRQSLKAGDNMAFSHIAAHKLIHDIYKKKGLGAPFVSIAKNLRAFVPCNNRPKNKFAAYLRDRLLNFSFIEKLIRQNSLDYIGINYYTRDLVDTGGFGLNQLLLETCQKGHHPLKKNSLGWEIYPQGLFDLLLKLKKYGLPLFILENGICTENDKERWDFIREHLASTHSAIEHGANILGYLYWSLIDNYEWDKGFGPRFGIVEVDYNTYKRTPRESAKKYASVCGSGKLA
ncbi:MAG: glycoside hydrolase family 1 protein [Candidatus Omnitrophota bacterium]